MMIFGIILVIVIIIFLIFFAVSTFFSIFGGINYVNSGNDVYKTALKIANLKKGERFYDLGSGTGNGLDIASNEFGALAYGVEISPLYYLISLFLNRKNKDIHIKFGNLKKVNLSKANVIYCYLSPKLMKELYPKLKKELKAGSRLISKSFQMHEIEPVKIKKIVNEKLYLYKF